MLVYWYGDSPSWGTQYTRSSSLLSKEEKDSWDDQDEGGGCSATDGGSMKLQLKVFSGSRWATENRKQTKEPRGHPEGVVPSYKNNNSAVIHSLTWWLCWKPFTANISNFEGWRGPNISCFLCFCVGSAKDKRNSVFTGRKLESVIVFSFLKSIS